MNATAMQSKVIGTGNPLVLIGGGLTGWLSWEPHTERLSASRKVVLLQLLNVQWGLEDRPFPEDYTVETEGRAIGAALDELDLTVPLDLVGWSYGALAALHFALDAPERIRSLTLIEPPALWVLRAIGPDDPVVQKEVALLEPLRGDISESLLEEFLETAGMKPPDTSVRDLPLWPVWSRHRQALRNNAAILAQRDDPKRLSAFTRPVLFVKGTGSPEFHQRVTDEIASRLPRAKVVEMPAGHAPHIVSMDRFLKTLAAFQAEHA